MSNLIIYIKIWLSIINIISMDGTGLEEDAGYRQLCYSTNQSAWFEVRVYKAFRHQKYIGVQAELRRPDTIWMTTLRVVYWFRPDITSGTNYYFYETAVWPAADEIIQKYRGLSFIFDTDGMNALFSTSKGDKSNQISSSIQYLVYVSPKQYYN